MNLRLQYNEKHDYFYLEEEIYYFFGKLKSWKKVGCETGSVAGIWFEITRYNSTQDAKVAMCEMMRQDIAYNKQLANRKALNLKDNEANGNFELSSDDYIIGKCNKIKDK